MGNWNELFENLMLKYQTYFDIERSHSFAGEEILAYARFQQRTEKYMLVRRAKMYAIEVNEHVFFVRAAALTKERWEKEKTRILAAEKDYVTPHNEHMYSYITLVLLCDEIEECVKKEIQRLRYTKNYRFSVQGYSAVRLGVVDVNTEQIYLNRQAKDLRKVLEQTLHM